MNSLQSLSIQLYDHLCCNNYKMLKKIRFSDSLLKDLGIINPESVLSYIV